MAEAAYGRAGIDPWSRTEKCRAEILDARTKQIRRCGNYARTADGGLCWRHR